MNARFPKAHVKALTALRYQLQLVGWIVLDSQWMRNPRCSNHYIVPAIRNTDDKIHFLHVSFHETGSKLDIIQVYSHTNSYLPSELPEVKTVANLPEYDMDGGHYYPQPSREDETAANS